MILDMDCILLLYMTDYSHLTRLRSVGFPYNSRDPVSSGPQKPLTIWHFQAIRSWADHSASSSQILGALEMSWVGVLKGRRHSGKPLWEYRTWVWQPLSKGHRWLEGVLRYCRDLENKRFNLQYKWIFESNFTWKL